jgi:hypothetical protein
MHVYEKKFKADAYTSRDYRCAVVLEEVLEELNDSEVTRKVNTIMQRFNKFFVDLKIVKNKNYYGSILIDHFEKEIMRRNDLPEFVRCLLMNIMRTKYKVEILGATKK